MNWIAFFLIACAVAAYIAWPLRRNAQRNASEYSTAENEAPGQAPVDARTALQHAVQQLDFDLSMGKIDEDEHRHSRASLENSPPVETSPSHEDLDLEAEILIARARRRKSEVQATSWSCDECGREMSGEDRFCASCGVARQAETVHS